MDTKIQISRKADGPPGPVDKARGEVYVLEDLIVHEVSSVDVPANKRRWLMIKNAQGIQGGTLVPDGKGGFVQKSNPQTTSAQPEATAAVAAAPAVDESAAEKASAASTAEPGAVDAASVVSESKDPDPGPTEAAKTSSEVTAASAGPATTAADVEISVDDATAAILEGAAGVIKAGRKISAERKARLQQIVESLRDLLAEVEDSKTAEDASEKAMRDMREEFEREVSRIKGELAQMQASSKSLLAEKKKLEATIEEMRASSKGTVTVASQTTKTALVSGQFDVSATATRPAATGWIGLQRELGQWKK